MHGHTNIKFTCSIYCLYRLAATICTVEAYFKVYNFKYPVEHTITMIIMYVGLSHSISYMFLSNAYY